MDLSVVVPIYNVAKYLSQCLESLKNQTIQNVEFILVNDGSTDSSEEICKLYLQDKRFKYFKKDNGGLMSAYLFGVGRASGKYIGFVDSDDYVEQEMFEVLHREAAKTDADIAMCDFKMFDKNGFYPFESYNSIELFNAERINQIHDNVFPSLSGGNISSARWNKVFKREIFLENIKYCEGKSRYFEDRFIVPACLFSAKKFIKINTPLYNYRLRKSANSKNKSNKLINSIEYLIDVQKQMLKDKKLYETYKNKLELAYLNYIKVVIERNVTLVKGFGGYKTCRQILNKERREIILKNKSSCINKFGKCLYFSAKFNSPFVIYFLSKIYKKNYKSQKFYFD